MVYLKIRNPLEVKLMEQKTVLVVDDEEQIRELLSLYLVKEGFRVIEAKDGAAALVSAEKNNPDIIVLDVMMPVLDGIAACQKLREKSPVPIILLTARDQDDDRIMGLEAGADDYVGKPFNPKELVARIKAVLRRAAPQIYAAGDSLTFNGLMIDMSQHKVTVYGEEIALTNKEKEVLWQLAQHKGKVLSREQLLEMVWNYSYQGDTRTVDTHVKRLRKKLGITAASPWDIKTIWGIGYKFEVK
jgi:DNA-binding response OmpR family regulator